MAFKKYNSAYKRSRSPFTENEIDYNERIGEPSRYKDRVKKDLKEGAKGAKEIGRQAWGQMPTAAKIGTAAVGAGILGSHVKGTIGKIKMMKKAKTIGSAAKIGASGILKGGLLAQAAPVVGGYLLAREIIRGKQRRAEKAKGSPYQKYNSAYKRDNSPFSKKK